MSDPIKHETKRPVRQHYSHAKADARKEKRRTEAEARQFKYDSLTTQQKFDLVVKRGGSARELARLSDQKKREKEAKKNPPKMEVPLPPVTEQKSTESPKERGNPNRRSKYAAKRASKEA